LHFIDPNQTIILLFLCRNIQILHGHGLFCVTESYERLVEL